MSDKAKRDRGYTVGSSGIPQARADTETGPVPLPRTRLPLDAPKDSAYYAGTLKKFAKQRRMRELFQGRAPSEGIGKFDRRK